MKQDRMHIEFSPVARLAIDYVNMTDRHVFLTGKAGTGKTTLLRHIIRHTHKAVVVAAPTGIAAINAGGVTLHSLLQLPFGVYLPENQPFQASSSAVTTPQTLFQNARFNKNKIKLLQQLELLIIDEVSMLRADLLDCIDQTLRVIRKKRTLPFGGLQVLFIGDLMQLPPVMRDEDARLLQPYYRSGYFFEARALAESPPIQIELTKIYRQSDPVFIDLLNAFRHNEQTSEHISLLNKHYAANTRGPEYEGYIQLTTHNYKADSINEQQLIRLKTRQVSLKATIEGDFPEHLYPNAHTLDFKEGAQVMFIKNAPQGDPEVEGKYYNGKIGQLTKVAHDEVQVTLDDGVTVPVARHKWENKRYTLNTQTNQIEETYLGSFEQYPLKLAWAVTIHKSQGLTFDKAILDLSGTFAPGQLYVALSRLTSLDGLVLSSRLPENPPDTDETLHAFLQGFVAEHELKNQLLAHRNQFIINLTTNTLDFGPLISGLQAHLATFDKSAARSVKQKHLAWTRELVTATLPLRQVGQKFVQQVSQIMHQPAPLEALSSRMDKARTYFEAQLMAHVATIRAHKTSLKQAGQVKKYLRELDELESLYLHQSKQIHKLALLVEASKEEHTLDREQLEAHTAKPELMVKTVTPEKKRPTAEISFELFSSGMTVEEVAEARGFVPATIMGHLTQYVEAGQLDALQLIDKEKLENILKVKATGAESMSDIKAKLGEEYSYADVKLALIYDELKHKNKD